MEGNSGLFTGLFSVNLSDVEGGKNALSSNFIQYTLITAAPHRTYFSPLIPHVVCFQYSLQHPP